MRIPGEVPLSRWQPLTRMSDEGRAVDRLAWPIIGDGLFQTVLDLTNLALVGRLGTAALGGVGAASPALAVLTVAAAILRALGNSHTPMFVTGLTNLINVAVTGTLIFGPAHLGVAGAGIGSTVARVSGAALLVVTLWRSGSLRGARFLPELPIIRRILNVGLPSLGEQLVLNFGMLLYGLIALRLGTA